MTLFKKTAIVFGLFVLVFGSVFIYRPDLILSSLNESNLAKIQDIEKNLIEKKYCFAYASDCRKNTDILGQVVDKINQDGEILWLVFGGDIIYDCNIREYRNFIKVMEGLRVPMLLSPGNHEMRGLGQILFRYFYGRTFFSFSFNGNKFILLDDSNTKSFGPVQKLWLRSVLKKDGSGNRFVFFHVPLYDKRTGMTGDGLADRNPDEAEEMLKILRNNKISHTFVSHLHGYYQDNWDGVPYTVSAGAGSVMHMDEPKENSFYNYLKIKVNGDKFDIEVVRI